ncbi:PMEI domain-containing protein, partial [Cephalotus follicularis]
KKTMSSFFLPSIVLVLFLCIALSHARLYSKISSSVLNNICFRTQNPKFCLGVLTSTPNVNTTDLPGLAKISIGIANASASNTKSFISRLIKTTSGPKLKGRYMSCFENYDDAIDDLEQAQQYLSSSDYLGVSVAASGAMDQAGDCNDDFKQPPAAPALLIQRNQVLGNLSDIILVISNVLRGQ